MRLVQSAITYGLYPFMLLVTGFLSWNAINKQFDLSIAFIGIAGLRFIFLQSTELIFPCRREWTITWRSLLRDAKYGLVNFGTVKLYGFLGALITIELTANNPGLIEGAPLLIEIIIVALVFEFLQYWFHRACHEMGGWVGDKLWCIHVAHHLPDKVYMVMHAVGHPLNLVVVFWFTPVAIWLTGASQEALMVWFAFRGLHGLMSHFNVEIRAGWLNYLFVGTELHRFHHSADLGESKNYGAFLVFWDLVFGTFVYKPGVNPARLGVETPGDYPASNEALKVLALPFVREKKARPAPAIYEA